MDEIRKNGLMKERDKNMTLDISVFTYKPLNNELVKP
jgi:hypothetical protein